MYIYWIGRRSLLGGIFWQPKVQSCDDYDVCSYILAPNYGLFSLCVFPCKFCRMLENCERCPSRWRLQVPFFSLLFFQTTVQHPKICNLQWCKIKKYVWSGLIHCFSTIIFIIQLGLVRQFAKWYFENVSCCWTRTRKHTFVFDMCCHIL